MRKEKIWRIILVLILLGVAFIFMVSIHRINKQTEIERADALKTIKEKAKSMNVTKSEKLDSLMTREVQDVITSPDLGSNRNTQKYLVALGTALLIGGASFCFGTLSGFLFGIPRVINAESTDSTVTPKSKFLHNDNLVQISDWLTKIIVGVGLTQINNAPEKLWALGKIVAPCFDPNGSGKEDNIAATISICVVLYFLILGFIASYLWTRVYFTHLFERDVEMERLNLPSNQDMA